MNKNLLDVNLPPTLGCSLHFVKVKALTLCQTHATLEFDMVLRLIHHGHHHHYADRVSVFVAVTA